MWVQMEVSPGVYGAPKEDYYSVDFVIDTLNQAYPGCMGVYLSKAGHILAFYGKRSVPNPGLTLEQGMEACRIIQEIPRWMGSLAQVNVQAISLQEAKETLAGLKRLEKLSLKRLQAQLTAMQLGSTLSVTAKPFTPLAASSGTVMSPSAAPRPLNMGDQPTTLYMSDDDGTTTDVSAAPHKKKKRGRRGSRRGRRSSNGSQTNSSSASPTGSRTGKKSGVTAKVSIPEYCGKGGHVNHISAFWVWARCITYYRDYYEDAYLFPLVVTLVKDDAAEMFDFTCSKKKKRGERGAEWEDLGQIIQRMREHYCGAFTFWEQRIRIENMKQGDSEEVADFLVKVTNAVNGLAKDWEGQLTEEELNTLQYEVFLNGVNTEIHHVLDAEVAKHPQMTPDQMYDAVRMFESYVARKERLDGKEVTPTWVKTPKAAPPAAPATNTGSIKLRPLRLWQPLFPKRKAPSLSPWAEKGLRDLRVSRKARQGCFCRNS